MKKLKRFQSIIIVGVILLNLLAVPAFAEESNELGFIGSTYSEKVIADGTDYATDYAFEYNGKTYQMLDTAGADGSKEFLIFEAEHNSHGKFDVDKTTVFDPNDENNQGYWLNKEVLLKSSPDSATYKIAGGNGLFNWGNAIDAKIRANIITNKTWLTEATTANGSDYTVTAGIVFPSLTEVLKYKDKMGGANMTTIWTRTAGSDTGVYVAIIDKNDGNKVKASIYPANSLVVGRCMYWLADDFFINNKVAPSDMGAEVKAFIANNITKDQMVAGGKYTDNELLEIGYLNTTAFAENVVISGKVAVGQKIAVQYIFNDDGLTVEEDMTGTTFKWYRADSVDGAYTLITGATQSTYVVQEDDLGKYLRAVVTPMDSAGNICVSGSAVVGPVVEQLPLTVRLIDTEKTANSFTAYYNIDNPDGEYVDDITLILAVYDENGVMEAVSYEEVYPEGEGIVSITGISLAGKIVKAMAWDNFVELHPLTIAECFLN